jgi:hypothetical protein
LRVRDESLLLIRDGANTGIPRLDWRHDPTVVLA